MNRILPVIFLMAAAPAHALDATHVSEPSQLVLVALAVMGVIIGRTAAKRRNHED